MVTGFQQPGRGLLAVRAVVRDCAVWVVLGVRVRLVAPVVRAVTPGFSQAPVARGARGVWVVLVVLVVGRR